MIDDKKCQDEDPPGCPEEEDDPQKQMLSKEGDGQRTGQQEQLNSFCRNNEDQQN